MKPSNEPHLGEPPQRNAILLALLAGAGALLTCKPKLEQCQEAPLSPAKEKDAKAMTKKPTSPPRANEERWREFEEYLRAKRGNLALMGISPLSAYPFDPFKAPKEAKATAARNRMCLANKNPKFIGAILERANTADIIARSRKKMEGKEQIKSRLRKEVGHEKAVEKREGGITAEPEQSLDPQHVPQPVPQSDFIAKEGAKPELVELMKEYEGKVWVGNLEGNGGRSVMIYVAPGLDESKPVEIIYYLHGMNGEVLNEIYPDCRPECSPNKNHINKFGRFSVVVGLHRVVDQCKLVQQEEDRNIILAYPISAGGRSKRKWSKKKNRYIEKGSGTRQGYDDTWMKPGNSTNDDMHKLHEEVLEALQEMGMNIQVGSITVKGHSAGGKPIENVAKSGFKMDRIDYHDASYGRWADKAYKAAIATNPNIQFNIFAIQSMSTSKNARRLAEKKGVTIRTFPAGFLPHTYYTELLGWENEPNLSRIERRKKRKALYKQVKKAKKKTKHRKETTFVEERKNATKRWKLMRKERQKELRKKRKRRKSKK